MTADILVRYLHFASILTLVAAVAAQHWGLQPRLTRLQLARLQRIDLVYGISAVIVLVTGLLQWFVVGKPASFYSPNGIFHLKITLFLLVGLISIYPSVFFGRQRKGEPSDEVAIPASLIWSVRLELILLFAMPLLATLMARGIGLST
ncbi:MAG: DUF2214 family protein [Opitutaceae bacterium]